MNLAESSSQDLLALHAEIVDVLSKRGILRTSNNPTGDLAEHLFCTARKLDREKNSRRGFDAIGPDGKRYQIKARKCAPQDKLRQLSAIRNLDDADFDFLIGIVFSLDYKIQRAAQIPYAVVKELVTPDGHINGHRFLLKDDVWSVPGVQDITDELKAVDLG
jgi:hypothetical protein